MQLRRQRLGVEEWVGVVLVAAGVMGFLLASDPTGGRAGADAGRWLLAMLLALSAIAALLVVGRGPQTRARAQLLGAAAGIANGVVALITKSFVAERGRDLPGVFASWQLYVLIGFGAAGFLFAQSAYQAAPLAESLPVMDLLEPLSSVVLAVGVLGEHVALAPLHAGIELAGVAAAIAGVVLLGRSPLVLSIYEHQQEHRESSGDAPRSDIPEFGEPAAPELQVERSGGSRAKRRFGVAPV